jgi:hypothetical protein
MKTTLPLACALVLLGCDGGTEIDAGRSDAGPIDAGGDDAGRFDAGDEIDAGSEVDAGDLADAGPVGPCGTARPSLTGITGTEGLVIARDGTIYFSRSRAVGRLVPGGTVEPSFVSISGEDTIWGLALDAANETLYVAIPGSGVRQIDLTAATPTAEPFVTAATQAPNGITVGPDGFVYYSDFGGGRVYRVDPADGSARTEVTTAVIRQANGVAFEPAGTLLVASYQDGTLTRLTLSAAGVETGRTTVTSDLGSPDGVVVAADGTIFVGDQGLARGVYRVSGGTVTPVQTGLSAPASVEFGAGALDCDDLYVAIGGGTLVRIDDVGPGAAVPWH